MRLIWDKAKNKSNQAKHGVAFSLVEEFDWATAWLVPDDRFDYGEYRVVAYGFIADRLHILCYVEKDHCIRIISLRKANPREVMRYEKVSQKS